MGSWSEDIFGNDIACDVRDAYRERIKAGDKPDVALKHVKKEFAAQLRDADDKRVIFIALAAAQLEAGKVTDTIRATALKAIAWCEHPNRDAEEFPFGLEALAQLREKLGGKAPAPRTASKPKLLPGEPGDVYAITLPEDGFCADLPDKPTEAVLFVGEAVTKGGRRPGTGRVVVLQALAAKDVTPETVAKALTDWRRYYQKWSDGHIGRGVFCYDAQDKLPARKCKLLLRGIPMPSGFAKRMRNVGAVYKSAELPWVVDRDIWDWRKEKWVADPKLDEGK